MTSNIQTAQELKRLRSQLAAAQGEFNAAVEAARLANKKASVAGDVVVSLRTKITDLQRANAEAPEPVVSEHAILRYLERVKGVDLEEVRLAILGGKTAESIKFAKTGTIKKGDMSISFVNNVVTTVKVAT